MKVYIPFNMIVDTDYGLIRLIEKIQDIDEYPINKLKAFLLEREFENPIIEYNRIRGLEISEYAYETILDKYYKNVLPLSMFTDLIAFVINTYKLGVSNELNIMVGCDFEEEMTFLSTRLRGYQFNLKMDLNSNIKLDEYDYIFTKVMDEYYVDYILDTLKLSGKRIYVADYSFNTIYDAESNTTIIDPMLHVRLESEGNTLCTVTLYNKKREENKEEN